MDVLAGGTKGDRRSLPRQIAIPLMAEQTRLLVNADDFGLHRDINRGILDCIDHGRLQSISFSAIGRAIDWQKLCELQRHGVRVGLHVTLVGEPWETDSRLFRNWKELVKQMFSGGDSFKRALEAEISRQFQLCAENGLDPHFLSHIDSHQHVHVLSGIWQPFVREKQKYHIDRIRIPWSPSIKKSLAGGVLQVLARRRRREIASLPCLGLAHAGQNTIDVFRGELAAAARSGFRDVEMVVHPGINTPALESRYADWNFRWTGERDALLSPEFPKVVAANGYAFATTS